MAPSASDLARGLLDDKSTYENVQKELSRQADLLKGSDDIAHFLWHFVFDQDIRAWDPDYARWQEGELRKLLGQGDESIP